MKHKGFTLIELLVVVSIIALLIGILLPALGSARATAKGLRSKSDLRQLLIGYTAYQGDYGGEVMVSYPPNTLDGKLVTVDFAGYTFGNPVSRRYPWRLVPYVAGVWEVLHNHTDTPEMPSGGDPFSVAFGKAYALSLSPSYGMNDVFVGGSVSNHGFTGSTPNEVRNRGAHVVFKDSEVRRPSELIVLGESQVRNIYPPPDNPQEGHFRLTPPHANGEQWRVTGGEFEIVAQTIIGLPQGRYGPTAAMGFFDGHVEGKSPRELGDMRYWANPATTEDYDYVP